MGACISSGVNYDKYSSDFLKELPITRLKDENYIAFLESKTIFRDKDVILREFIKNKNPIFLDENQKFFENLNALPVHLIYLALLFLTEFTFKSISSTYMLSVEKIKNKYFEHTKKKLEGLNESDYEVLREVLICYCKIISYDIINSSLQVETAKREANVFNKDLTNIYGKEVFENFKKLLFVYHSDIIERFVGNFLFSNLNASSTINHEDFFRKNVDFLNHENVRRKLREIFDENYSISFDNKSGKFILNGIQSKNKIVDKVINIKENPIDAIENYKLVSSTKPVELTPPTVIGMTDTKKEFNNFNLIEEKVKEKIQSNNKSISDSYMINNTYSPNKVKSNIENNSYYSNSSTTRYYDPKDFNLISSQIVSSSKPIEQTSYTYSYPLNTQTPQYYLGSTSLAPKNFDGNKFNIQLFKSSFLNFHNIIRKKHQSLNLEEDSSLNLYAQIHANFLAKVDELSPSDKLFGEKILGENIAKANGTSNEAVESILKDWYEQRNIFDFGNPRYIPEASNFTQMIWRDSKQIGMGVAFSSSGYAYVVTNYYPEGNTFESFVSNVNPAFY